MLLLIVGLQQSIATCIGLDHIIAARNQEVVGECTRDISCSTITCVREIQRGSEIVQQSIVITISSCVLNTSLSISVIDSNLGSLVDVSVTSVQTIPIPSTSEILNVLLIQTPSVLTLGVS